MTDHAMQICCACGTEYRSMVVRDNSCPVCLDDRQYIPAGGQRWTTHDQLLKDHAVQIKPVMDSVFELTIIPSFAIGQRAFLILSRSGNILWDCIPLLDEAAAAFISAQGGLKAIAISHPHYYSNVIIWARRFNCPVFIHGNDRDWAPKDDLVHLWNGQEHELWDGIKLICTGGHFPGASVLLAPALAGQRVLFCADSLFISKSRKHISVMYSYPNVIPLPAKEVARISELMHQYPFDCLLGAFAHQTICGNAKEIFAQSMMVNMR